MTAASYTEDLSDLATGDESTGWVELTGTIGGEAYDANGIPAYQDPDYPYIQGSYSVTQDCTKDTSVGSLAYNNTTGTGGHGTDGAYFVWQNYMVSSNIGTYAQGGFQICVGSSAGDYDVWYVGGSDKSPYPYGGWVNNVANTTVTPDGTAGTPTATEQYIGSAVYVAQGSSKGEVHNCDVIRYGRGSAIFEFGDITNGYATIAGFATQNDNVSNRWGLIQATAGGYLWKGRMQLGTATNAVDFRDSNVTIFIQWTPKVTANFNLIECINASSNIEMTGFQIVCLDTTTASKGRFLMTNQCNVQLDTSTFIDMDTFVFDWTTGKTVSVTGCVFRRCGQITQGGATMTGNLFSNHTSGTTLVVSDLSKVTGNTFVSDGANHAVDVGNVTTSTAVTWNNTTSGYASGSTGDPVTEDGTTNATLLCNVSASQKLTVNVSTGATIPSIKNDGTGTVAVVQSVTVTITVKDEAGVVIQNAQVGVFLTSDGTQVINADTNASGIVTDSFGGTTPAEVKVWIRKASSGATKYKNYSSVQNITSSGLTLSVTLIEDPLNNATS